MATAIDVMKYIKSQKSITGEVQLQKLVYYSQAWSLAWDGVSAQSTSAPMGRTPRC